MRVLFWTETFWPEIGGVETFCAQLITELKRRGHECLVLANDRNGLGREFDSYQGTPIHRFRFHQTITKNDLSSMRAIHQACGPIVEAFAPDVIHLNSQMGSAFYFLIFNRTWRLPSVLTVHTRLAGESCDQIYANLFQQVDVLAAVSPYMAREILALQPQRSDRLRTIANALPPVAVEPAPLPRARLLTFGRMVPEKGFDLVLRAFAQVAPHFPEAVLTMASDGVERENLRRLGETLGLGDRVTFPGWIAEEDMPALINDHSLVMVPSRHEEPFGLVALQAAQMGRPVIAARSGGLAEIVQPGATGLLFERDDADSLADALAVLLRDPEMMTRMGIAARDHAIRHYDYGAFVSAYEELYGEALRRKKQSQTAVAA